VHNLVFVCRAQDFSRAEIAILLCERVGGRRHYVTPETHGLTLERRFERCDQLKEIVIRERVELSLQL